MKQTTEPRNRSEQEIAGYRYVLDVIHANAENIDFEPRFIEQLPRDHGFPAGYAANPRDRGGVEVLLLGQWR